MNLSDGKEDGIVLFYNRGGELYPVILNEEQRDMLEITLSIPFKESKLKVYNKSMGKLTNLKEDTK